MIDSGAAAVIVAGIVVVASYLAGTFPTALLVGRRLGFDVTSAGSGNPGASNAYRVGGRRAGALVFAGDLLKGAAPTAIGLLIGGRPLGVAAGIAAVVGHIAPITRRFRGGKGVATAAGMGIVLYPLLAPVLALMWFLVARLTGKAALASLVTVIGFVAAVALIGAPAWEVLAMAAVAVLILVRHWGNVVRLVRGSEHSLQGAQPG
jgi:glycerol-3-phosphate acyltransferase PlsY